MALHSSKPGFGLTTLDLEPPNTVPDVSENIQQALAFLMVFDTVNNHWVPLTGNADGASLVTSAAPQLQAPKANRIIIPAVAAIIFNPNPLRKQLLIEFQTDTPCYIGFDSGLSPANGWIQNPGSFFSIDNFTGAIWGMTGTIGKSVPYIEV